MSQQPIQKIAIYQLTTPYTKDICIQSNVNGCVKFSKQTFNAGTLLSASPDNTVTIDDTKTLYVRGIMGSSGQTEVPLSLLKKLGENLTPEEANKLTSEINNKKTFNNLINDSKKTITIVVVVIAVLGLLKWKKII
jgi:hypothetical protein